MRYALIALLIAGYGLWACQTMIGKLMAKKQDNSVIYAQQFSGE